VVPPKSCGTFTGGDNTDHTVHAIELLLPLRQAAVAGYVAGEAPTTSVAGLHLTHNLFDSLCRSPTIPGKPHVHALLSFFSCLLPTVGHVPCYPILFQPS
jgi:hypothetical protein